jgi:ectoine hydroxylase
MQLSQAQLDEFDNNGFIVLPQLFSKEEIALLKTELVSLFDSPHPANITEQNGDAVRTAMALHQRNPVFKRLPGHPRLL